MLRPVRDNTPVLQPKIQKEQGRMRSAKRRWRRRDGGEEERRELDTTHHDLQHILPSLPPDHR